MIVVDGESVVEVKAYIERHLKIKISEPSRTLGFVSDSKKPLCAVVFNEYNEANIELTIVAEKGGVTLGVCRYICEYVFVKLNCRRLTVRCKRSNKWARKMAVKAGFKYESVAKHFFPDSDATVLRMLKDECRFIKHERIKASANAIRDKAA